MEPVEWEDEGSVVREEFVVTVEEGIFAVEGVDITVCLVCAREVTTEQEGVRWTEMDCGSVYVLGEVGRVEVEVEECIAVTRSVGLVVGMLWTVGLGLQVHLILHVVGVGGEAVGEHVVAVAVVSVEGTLD